MAYPMQLDPAGVPGSLNWADAQYSSATDYWKNQANDLGLSWSDFNGGAGAQYGYKPGVSGYVGANANNTPYVNSTFGIATVPGQGSYFAGPGGSFNGLQRSGYAPGTAPAGVTTAPPAAAATGQTNPLAVTATGQPGMAMDRPAPGMGNRAAPASGQATPTMYKDLNGQRVAMTPQEVQALMQQGGGQGQHNQHPMTPGRPAPTQTMQPTAAAPSPMGMMPVNPKAGQMNGKYLMAF